MADVKTINVYLLRHGKTVGEPGLYGHTDIVVDDKQQQTICGLLSEQAIEFEAVESSPLKRCQDLAHLVSHSRNLEPLITPRWQETFFGDYDGIPFEKIRSHWQELDAFWANPAKAMLPNAEPLEDFYYRIHAAWQTFSNETEQDTLIICHGGTIRMILASILNLDWRNPQLYSTLHIAHQSITHIQIIKADKTYFRVCMIGKTLEG